MKELRKIVGNDICIAIAGNKIDLEKDRHVDTKEALSYAESVGAAHYNTSAKINKGLEEVFGDLSKSKLYGSAMTQIMSNYFPSFSSSFFLYIHFICTSNTTPCTMVELEMLQRRSGKASGVTTLKGKQRLVIIEDTPLAVNKKSGGCC